MEKEFIMIDDDNGFRPKYLFKDHDMEVETYREDFQSYVRRFISRFADLVSMIGDDAYDQFGMAFDVLVRDSLRQLELTCEIIDKEIGEIYIDTSLRNKPPYYLNDDPVGAIMEPKKISE